MKEIVNTIKNDTIKNCNVLSTGFVEIDKYLNGGLNDGQLIVIAAAPGIGKTTLAINIIINECFQIAQRKNTLPENVKPQQILFMSLEMDEIEITSKMVSKISEKPYSYLKDKKNEYSKQDKEVFEHAYDLIHDFSLTIKSKNSTDIENVKKNINILSSSYDLRLVVIDHLHMMDYDRKKETAEISEITKTLKHLAQQYNVPIILLSQVNKNEKTMGAATRSMGGSSKNKSDSLHQDACIEPCDVNRIGLNELRGSGSIVQDANIIMLL
jgi:replicative DNA helicase